MRPSRPENWTHRAKRLCTESCCSAINGTWSKAFSTLTLSLLTKKQGRWDNCAWPCRGLLLEEKPELKRVLEQRRLELHKENDLAQRRPSDLEMELCKRQQKLQQVQIPWRDLDTFECLKWVWWRKQIHWLVLCFFQYEQEEIRQRENLQKIPEFVRVKDNLRPTQTFEQWAPKAFSYYNTFWWISFQMYPGWTDLQEI